MLATALAPQGKGVALMSPHHRRRNVAEQGGQGSYVPCSHRADATEQSVSLKKHSQAQPGSHPFLRPHFSVVTFPAPLQLLLSVGPITKVGSKGRQPPWTMPSPE